MIKSSSHFFNGYPFLTLNTSGMPPKGYGILLEAAIKETSEHLCWSVAAKVEYKI